jgi:alkaline phosphatase D
MENMKTPLARRSLLLRGVSFGALALLGKPVVGLASTQAIFAKDPFTLGVASGDPLPNGIVLWTRLAPVPLLGGGMPDANFSVGWEVAEDEKMARIIRQGVAVASPGLAHSVHIEVDGLKPDRWYWYRFHVGDAVSPIGRTRTAPTDDALNTRCRFGFASCQNFEDGYFTAYKDMVESDLDLIIHLGDYIYEQAPRKNKVRTHSGDGELNSLASYRNRHAQYKTDLDLQRAHQLYPWLVTWDDHEFDNNCAGDISEEAHVGKSEYLERRACAYQAYYEHMPLRATSVPKRASLQLYRTISFGQLLRFQVLDTRQYRSDQPCGDGNRQACEGVFDPKATILGTQQEQWLEDALRSSPAKWNVLAQQIMMGRVDRAPGESVAWSMDQWGGYDVPRKRLLTYLRDQKIRNPVVLTGDIHSNWVNDLKIDFDNLEDPTVATEFVGTSISSGGNGKEQIKASESFLSENPFVKFYNAERGYVRCEVTEKSWTSEYRVFEEISKPDVPGQTRATFVVESDAPGAKLVSGV